MATTDSASGADIVCLYGSPEGEPLKYTISDTYGIEKGSLMTLIPTADRTISGACSTLTEAPFAGIANAEKKALDGSTTLGVWTKGRFNIWAVKSPAIAAGQMVVMSGANLVTVATDDAIENHSHVVGMALEPTADGTQKQIQVQLGS